MSMDESRGAEWYLIAISVVADTAGVLGFIGFQANRDVRLAVAGICALIGAIAAAATFVKTLLIWLSPAGAYVPKGRFAKNFIQSLVALLVSLAIGFAFFALAGNGNPDVPSPGRVPSPLTSTHR